MAMKAFHADENRLLSSLQETLQMQNNLQADGSSASTNGSEPAGIMTVKVSKTARVDKDPKYIYPYKPLQSNNAAYRGYPIDGTESLKRCKKWKIQIVNPAVGSPPEPLPQFPQQETLVRTKQGYVGAAARDLTEKETMNNSGEIYISGVNQPKSEYFFTAGYTEGSAVRLQKPFPESIYHYFVAGQPVPVKVVKGL